MNKLIKYAGAILLGLSSLCSFAQDEIIPQTYCNPVDMDYTYMVYNSKRDISYRSGADPAAVEFRGEYYMFVTRSFGYWHSTDLVNWSFIEPEKWYFEGCNAPTAFNYKDSILYMTGDPAGYGSILYTDDPKAGKWKPVPSINSNIQDSELFIDDDGQTYLYWGSSNVYPIKAKKLNKEHRMIAEKGEYELFNLDEEKHGWERFGEDNFHPTVKEGYIEGASMTKHNGKYYLQYAAPGTQFNVYGEGVYVGDSPLGPFEYMPNNPYCFKPGGFMNGAGHGTTMKDKSGQYWHFATMALASNSHWERRICLYPTYFDDEGLMHSDTHYGDYPRYGSWVAGKKGQHTGWMLLSYNSPTTVSTSKLMQKKSTSTDNTFDIEDIKAERNAKNEIISPVLTDENTKSYWVAEANDAKQWVKIDMQKTGKVYALQINYMDYQSEIYTRVKGLRHRFTIESSLDGKSWQTIVDRSNSFKDTPNAYLPLDKPVRARYIRYNHIESPSVNLAISDIRVFGLGEGKKPSKVKNFKIDRQDDRRDIIFTWDQVKGAQGYNIRWGIAPDKLYSSWMIYGDTEKLMRIFGRDQAYFFTIESFNENGISERMGPFEVK